jgi:hypothetical protein
VVAGCLHCVLGMVRGADCALRPTCVVFQCICMRATQRYPRRDGAVSGAPANGCAGVGRGGRVRAQCVGHGVSCRLHAAPCSHRFPVLLHAGYSAVCAAGWCGKWGGARALNMDVREVGWGGRVHVHCVGRGERCRLRAAPHLRGFPVHMHAGYSAVCAAGWCGEWRCAWSVHMGVRGWGMVGRFARSVSGMVRGSGCAQRPACVCFQCIYKRATRRCARWDGSVSGAVLVPCTWVCGGWGVEGGCVHSVLGMV